VLAAMVVVYLVLIELGKRRFYRVLVEGPPIAHPAPDHERRIHHRASRWSTLGRPRRRDSLHHRRRARTIGSVAQ
jgi:hypothetical protein